MTFLSRLFGSEPPKSAAPLPYPANSKEALAARWMRWVADCGHADSPITDATGKRADFHQPDDVWFLAGTFGKEVTREVTIPAKRPLFFPVITMWRAGDTSEVPILTEATGEASLDGEPLALTEIATPQPFEVLSASANPISKRNRPTPVVIWGLWGQLIGLKPGLSILKFHGTDGHQFSTSVTYRLTSQ